MKQHRRWPRTADAAGQANTAGIDIQRAQAWKERWRRVRLGTIGCGKIGRIVLLIQVHGDLLSPGWLLSRTPQVLVHNALAPRKRGYVRSRRKATDGCSREST